MTKERTRYKRLPDPLTDADWKQIDVVEFDGGNKLFIDLFRTSKNEPIDAVTAHQAAATHQLRPTNSWMSVLENRLKGVNDTFKKANVPYRVLFTKDMLRPAAKASGQLRIYKVQEPVTTER